MDRVDVVVEAWHLGFINQMPNKMMKKMPYTKSSFKSPIGSQNVSPLITPFGPVPDVWPALDFF